MASSSSPLNFGLVTYDSDSSDFSVELEEPNQIAVGNENSSPEVPQQSSSEDDHPSASDNELEAGCSGVAREEQEEPLAQPPDCSSQKRKPYAADLNQLSRGLRDFLDAVRIFHTQKVNVQRQKAALSQSTYSKAQERMLCEFKLFLVFLFLLYFIFLSPFFTFVSSF